MRLPRIKYSGSKKLLLSPVNIIFSLLSTYSFFLLPVLTEVQKNSNISVEFETLKTDEIKNINTQPIEWELIHTEDDSKSKIEWSPVELNNDSINLDNNNNIKSNLESLYQKDLDFNLLNLGRAVSTPKTLKTDDLRLSIGQVAFTGKNSKGTGNQNYIGEINYGLSDNLLFSIFYTDADDPLINKISKVDTQPENRWSNYGSSIKWKWHESPKLQIAAEGAIENWLVQSGGCSGHNCSLNTSNIFNSETSMVENNNFIGSISLPIGFRYSSNLEFTISPKLTFLPNSQGNQYGDGNFYGQNSGLGLGGFYKPSKRLNAFTSYYFPISESKNSFNENLNFTTTSIYSAGLTYSLDSKIAFQGFVTNGFGLTPSTSILSIPSSKDILYGFNIIYTPTNMNRTNIYEKQITTKKNIFNGLSVSNNRINNSGTSLIHSSYDGIGNWSLRYEKALSDLFTLDLITAGTSEQAKTDSIYKTYISPGNTFLRFGGKAKILSQDNGNIFTTSIRGSFGRLLAEDKHGYFFGEVINSYEFSEKLIFNLNPKITFSGSGESLGLGTSLHWEFLKGVTLIPETNIAIDDAQSNITFAIRFSPEGSNRHIDIYTSNAYSLMDVGQLMKRNESVFGISLGKLF